MADLFLRRATTAYTRLECKGFIRFTNKVYVLTNLVSRVFINYQTASLLLCLLGITKLRIGILTIADRLLLLLLLFSY